MHTRYSWIRRKKQVGKEKKPTQSLELDNWEGHRETNICIRKRHGIPTIEADIYGENYVTYTHGIIKRKHIL